MQKLYALAAWFADAMPNWKYLPKDKLAHFFSGALVALPFWLFGYDLLGLAVVVAAAFGKEVVDYLSNRALVGRGLPKAHGVELMDAIATVLGGVAVVFADEAFAVVKHLTTLL